MAIPQQARPLEASDQIPGLVRRIFGFFADGAWR